MDEQKCEQCKHHATFNYGLSDVMWCTKTTNLFPFSLIELVHQCPGFEPLQSGKVTEEEIKLWKMKKRG